MTETNYDYLDNIKLNDVIHYALSKFKGGVVHGVTHWENVDRNGLRLSEKTEDVNKRVVRLLQGEPISFKKRQTSFNISGRGGTDFQPVFDYAKNHPEYDGVIIFTDGYANHPQKKPGTKARFVYVLRSEAEYNTHHDWMNKTGKSCFLTA